MKPKNSLVKVFSPVLAFLVLFTFTVRDGLCITISEEEKLSREFMSIVRKSGMVITDPDIDEYINRIGGKIAKEFPNPPFPYHFYVVREDSYNAFAAPGGHVFVNSGLIEAMDTEEELAGILGHEISHVNLRHISSRIDYSQKIGMGTLAGMVAGILLGIGGAGAAAGALTAGSMAAGQSMNLAYTRENEIQADQTGLQYINSAGYSCTGLVSSFTKMRSKQWFGPNQIPTYLNTHPAGEERMSYIKAWIEQHEKGKKFKGSADPASFRRIRARISGFYGDQNLVVKKFESRLAANPSDDSAVYGLAMAYLRLGENEKAIEKMRILLRKNAFDPYYMRDTGIIQFSMGDMDSALAALENRASKGIDALRLLYLGRTLMAKGRDTEAERSLSTLIKDKKDFSDGYYYMAEVYQKTGREGLSHYYLGVYESMIGRPRQTVFHLDKAMPSIGGYPDLKKNAERLLKEALKEMKKERDEKDIKEKQRESFFIDDRVTNGINLDNSLISHSKTTGFE